ncbi:MAG: hypothetical protein HYS38_05200 [Acidobacteria bacterium]|nr:hypothetical protein [Acidobacteriota bacterium]
MSTVLEIAPKFDWLPVVTKNDVPYFYPNNQFTLSRDTYSRPAIYRWSLHTQEGKRKFLVGETENLYKRIGHYLKHGNPRNTHHIKIREMFDKTLDSGGEVSLEILKFEPFKINGVSFLPDRLYDPFVRLVLENLCCLQVAEEHFQLVNATVKRKTKRELEKTFREHPEEASKILKEFMAQKTAKAS